MFNDFCKPHDDELNKIISSAYIRQEMGVPFNLTGSLSIRSSTLERSSIYILKRCGLKLQPCLSLIVNANNLLTERSILTQPSRFEYIDCSICTKVGLNL